MEYSVDIIPQESSNTCWAAAMAMLLTYLCRRAPESLRQSPFEPRFTPAQVASLLGGVYSEAYAANRMLVTSNPANFSGMASRWGLLADPEHIPGPSGWEQALDQWGPIFAVVDMDTNDHAVVIAGADGDQLLVVDPWPMRRGRRSHYPVSFVRTRTIIHRTRDADVLQSTRGGGG